MNENPIFGNYRSRILYAGIWIIVTFLQTVVVYFSISNWGSGSSNPYIPFVYILADTVIFCFLFACIIVQLWYPVRFNHIGASPTPTWRFIIVAHFLFGLIVVALWLITGYGLCYLISFDNNDYLHFLNNSLRWKALEGFMFYIISILVYYLFIHVEQLKEKATNELRLNNLLRDGELNLLKSQINPHFLFNSMNSVNSLILHNPEQSQKMLVALSDYLRYSVLTSKREFSTVSEEMDNIERYLSIEKLRFGDKILYEADIDSSCNSTEIPAMLLQPLFENCIKHGVYESLESVHITAKINKKGQYLQVILSNNFDKDGVSQKKGSGTGLNNIRERLRLQYGNAASIQTKVENSVFTVILKIPIK